MHMNSVETGQIIENTLPKAGNIAEFNYFQRLIDEIDTTSRALDPIFIGERENIFPYSNFS